MLKDDPLLNYARVAAIISKLAVVAELVYAHVSGTCGNFPWEFDSPRRHHKKHQVGVFCYSMNMDKELLKRQLEIEGFPIIYEWHDDPGTQYPLHQHQDKVSMFITKGSLEFDFSGQKKVITAGERMDVPPKTIHSAIVGPEGCDYIVGQMTENDA